MMDETGINYRWVLWFTELIDSMPRGFSVTFNPSSVSANSTSEQTFTVSGANTNDVVVVNKPTHTAGLGIVNARVSAADTVAVTFMNTTGSAIDPPSETYTGYLVK